MDWTSRVREYEILDLTKPWLWLKTLYLATDATCRRTERPLSCTVLQFSIFNHLTLRQRWVGNPFEIFAETPIRSQVVQRRFFVHGLKHQQ